MEAKRGVFGRTCLMTASFNGHLSICRLLIDKGAQLEAKDVYGNTPLHFAADQGHIEVVRLFCDRGADVKACEYKGLRPLHYAAIWGHISVVKDLIEVRNAEINARNSNGWTALTCARQNNKPAIAIYIVSHGGID